MMGIIVPETCWASSKICNKNHLLHLVWTHHYLTPFWRSVHSYANHNVAFSPHLLVTLQHLNAIIQKKTRAPPPPALATVHFYLLFHTNRKQSALYHDRINYRIACSIYTLGNRAVRTLTKIHEELITDTSHQIVLEWKTSTEFKFESLYKLSCCMTNVTKKTWIKYNILKTLGKRIILKCVIKVRKEKVDKNLCSVEQGAVMGSC